MPTVGIPSPGPEGLRPKLAEPRGSGPDALLASTPALPRPRLHELMERSARYPVTVLSAPAGAGKTLLLASWLQATPNRVAACVTLDEKDNQPEVFWSGLLQAVQLGRTAAQSAAVPALRSVRHVDDRCSAQFMNAANRLQEPLVLALDDVHELTDPAVLDGFGKVLRRCPPRLKVILSGRGEPPLPLARLRVAGQVADLRFADLACTEAEAHDLFALLGIEASDTEIATVLRRTEGWMAGLRLAAIWWRAQPPARRHFDEFTGAARVVADYLDDEVLGNQSPATLRFLLQTCGVETLTGDLADSLTGRHDGGRTLDRLERENALVTPVDARRSWFRYHTLLRDHLLAWLARDMPDQIVPLLTSAARWYAHADMTVEALRCAEDAEDWDLAAQLLIRDGNRTVDQAPNPRIATLLDRIPESYVGRDPRVAVVYARARLRSADPDGAERYLRVVDRIPEAKWRSTDDLLTHKLRRTELRLLQACLRGDIDAGDLNAAHATLEQAAAADEFNGTRPTVAATAFQLALAHLWKGELLPARESLKRALGAKGSADTHKERVWAAVTAAADGRLVAAERLVGGMQPADGYEMALTQFTGALACLERDRLGEAYRLLDPAAFAATPPGEPPLAEAAALCRARLLTVWGDHRIARNELQVARRPGPGLHSQLVHTAEIFETELLLRERQIEPARETLLAALASAPIPNLAADAVALGRFHLAAGEPASALDVVAPCLAGMTVDTRLLDTVAAHLVAATAHRLRGAPAVAKQHVELALALADEDGLVRVFIDAGRTVRSVLTVMVPPDGPYGSARSRILHHFETQSAKPVGHGPQGVTLTASEAAVLQYLPSHLTNDEIAADLCVSINTVKSHLRSLYRKLNVAHRREAIALARQLDLLR